MSLLKKNNTQNVVAQQPSVDQLVDEEMPNASLLPNAKPGVHSVKIMLDTNFTGRELKEGAVVNLSDYMSDGDANVILNKVSTTALGSQVPASVLTSANLFNTRKDAHYADMDVKNSQGWLSGDVAAVQNGMQPLCNILPLEYNRQELTHYSPESHLEDRLVQKYGHFAGDKDLWDGIVAFPKEPYYYVDRDHVALNIIAKNWEQLGINLPSERFRDERWVKVASSVVDKVIGELQSSVIDKMPFTNLSKLKIQFKSNNSNLEDHERYPLAAEYRIDYTIPQIASAAAAAE